MSQTANLSRLASLPSPLPPAPDREVFSPAQWDMLLSILEVILPSVSTQSSAVSPAELEEAVTQLKRYMPADVTEADARAYLAESVVADAAFEESLRRKFKLFVPPQDADGLGFVLSTLNTTVGSYLLTGYATPLHRQDLATRTTIVCGWSTSRLPLLRTIFRTLSGLARQTWVSSSSHLPRMLGFPSIPKGIERGLDVHFTFHDFSSPATSTTLATDVVVIGSGCGAGVVASHLARAGLACLVLEKSYHFPSTHFPMSAAQAGEHLMENGGTVLSDDGSIVVLAGSTFGGGGTVNWSASLQPQYAVRKEWAAGGLPHFLGAEFQDCLDTVCRRMGVADATNPEALKNIEHNYANATLLEGARRLGMAAEIVPQNTLYKRHFCGYCTYGCAGATKQGPANCWFPDARRHGAEFIEGAFVDEVTFADHPSGHKTASGVKATWTSRDRKTTRSLTIFAKRVVVAAGSLNSPLVLLRSGLKNPHIGANLHLHPTGQVVATWRRRTNPWEGAILTAAVTGLENLDGAHHGPKIEVICSAPGMGLLIFPFRAHHTLARKKHEPGSVLAAAIDYRVNVVKYSHASGFISITRDADTGRVYLDPKDPTRRRLRIAYTPSPRDLAHILEGQLAGARIQFTMGAVGIDLGNPQSHPWIRPSSVDSHAEADDEQSSKAEDEQSFEAWVTAQRALGLHCPDPCLVGSAHQMGSCRMSATTQDGVVDSRGQVWGVDCLYVADASVFPSASGVNPMVSTMGMAEWISRGIVKEMQQTA